MRVLRIVVPGTPLIVALVLTALSPPYLSPLLSAPIGWIGITVVLALAATTWWTVPALQSVRSGLGSGVLWALWAAAATIPGLFIVVMGPAIIVVAHTLY